MTWPGAPKSQQTPPINPPSTRTPPILSENSTMSDVADAVKTAFDGLTVHEQAFANLPQQIATQAKAAATAAVENIENETVQGVTSFNSRTGAVIYFPGMGTVNDQLGNPTYETQPQDNGAKIIVGDSSGVTVTLNSSVTAPWFTIIDNDSSSVAILMPDASSSLFGARTIPPGGFGIVFFDGADFWCGADQIATDSSLGLVEPDGVTINIDSGIIYTQVFVDSGPPSSTPVTPGSPFYFDSSMSPWNGYVWWENSWNRFN